MEFIEKLKEAVVSVLPVSIIVVILHFFAVPLEDDTFAKFLIGTVLVIVGMGIFLRGTEVGIMPMGQHIGSSITRKKNLFLIVFVGFVIGALITIVEPDVIVLAKQVAEVSDGIVSNYLLIISVAIGVGIFVSFALVRIVIQFSLRKALIIGYSLLFIVAFFTSPDFLSISFDSGGVTTGAMTVPFLLSLGFGVSAMRSGKAAEDDCFGIVGLASLGPIFACLILGGIYR